MCSFVVLLVVVVVRMKNSTTERNQNKIPLFDFKLVTDAIEPRREDQRER